MYSSSAIVGRKQELLEFENALNDLLAGRGSLYVIEGESGIGKTRLVREFAARASKRNVKVLWEASDGILGGGRSLWPWFHIVIQNH